MLPNNLRSVQTQRSVGNTYPATVGAMNHRDKALMMMCCPLEWENAEVMIVHLAISYACLRASSTYIRPAAMLAPESKKLFIMKKYKAGSLNCRWP